MKRFFDIFNNLYLVWLVGLALIAFWYPSTMLWFDGPWIFWSLAASMLGMGLTLHPRDFRTVGEVPGAIALGFGAQYTLMPLCGWSLATLLRLDTGLAAALAKYHFASMPLAAVGGVFSSVMQNIIGGLFASLWKRRRTEVDEST